nr:MAG TPA: tail tube protein [Caudoviricetes sp.]
MADEWKYMKAHEGISGKEGTLYATVNNQVIPVMECKSITAKITKNKTEFKALGYRGTQQKATGWSGTGTLTIHYASSRWAKMMIDYAKNGVDTYFKLQITNHDPTSGLGTQKVSLIDVNFDEAEIAKLDTDAEFLDEQMNFTFSDIDMADADMFKDITTITE